MEIRDPSYFLRFPLFTFRWDAIAREGIRTLIASSSGICLMFHTMRQRFIELFCLLRE